MRGILVGVLLAGWSAGAQTLPQSWVEATGWGYDVRAIVAEDSACPVVRANGKRLVLKERVTPPAPSFAVKGCGAALPAGVKTLRYGKVMLPVPQKRVKRIVVIGDTGCRISDKEVQDCETDWPFAKIVGFAAAKHPDLVVHVGDFYYREKCPEGEAHCENWENWRKDFFAPAGPLLLAAPWVLARGNHEMCGRAADGWFRFLDAGATPLSCPDAGKEAAPFAVKLDGVTLAVVDSSAVPENWNADQRIGQYLDRERSLGLADGTPVWIVTHKPPYIGGLMGNKETEADEETDAKLTGVQMFVSGHLHMFGSLSWGAARPVELIVGDSGTKLLDLARRLDKAEALVRPGGMLEGEIDVDHKRATYSARGRFGYMVLDRQTSVQWKGTLHGVGDEVLATCFLSGRTMDCAGAKTH